MKNLIIFLILIILPQFANAKENIELKGHWFECEFSEKTTPPKDQCDMLDDDGFNFKKKGKNTFEKFFFIFTTSNWADYVFFLNGN